MTESNEKITPLQWTLLITGFIQGSILLLSLVDSSLKQDTWVAILTSCALSIPFIVMYFSLSKQFPGKTLIEIHDIVYGKVLGKILSALYLSFFFLLYSVNIRQIVDFYNGYIFQETNPVILYLTVTLFCTYAVKKGIAAIAKINVYAFVFGVITNIVTLVLLLGHMDFSNYLPMFEASFTDFFKGTSIMLTFPYCEVISLMMVMPYVKITKEKGKSLRKSLAKYAVIGCTIAMLSYLLIDMKSTTTLGASRSIYAESSYQAVRLINIGEFLTRMELFVALYSTAAMFIKISVWQFAAVKSTAQFFGLKTYIPLQLPMAALAIVSAIIAFDSVIDMNEYIDYYIVLGAVFEFLIPIITLAAAKFRRLPKAKEVAS